MSDNCIDGATMNRYYNFVAIWKGQETANGDYITSIGDIAHVIANICDCNFRQPLIDVSDICYTKTSYTSVDPDTGKPVATIDYVDFRCGLKTMSKNLLDGAFITAGTISDLL